jgi:hypothetical protein
MVLRRRAGTDIPLTGGSTRIAKYRLPRLSRPAVRKEARMNHLSPGKMETFPHLKKILFWYWCTVNLRDILKHITVKSNVLFNL